MTAELFRTLRLPLTREQFHRLPRHPAYAYEWIEGEAWLSPRARYHHALLDLHSFSFPADPLEGVSVQRVQEPDWQGLPELFALAFRGVQPYASLTEGERLLTAINSIEQTRNGGDGPLVGSACFVARDEELAEVCGVILVTLIPLVDLSDPEASARWDQAPPAQCLERRLGRPHLTWVFVRPGLAGQGVGSTLLAFAVRELTRLGFHDLATTFLGGNEASMLWHWRNGFRLLAHAGSWRELRRRWK